MRFRNQTNNTLVRDACIFAHYKLDYDSAMLAEIRKKNDFRYDSGTGEEIYAKFLTSEKVVDVLTYKPKNRFTRAIGGWDGQAIHLNIYKLPSLSIEDAVANLCHEYCHAIGYNHGKWPFGNYKTENKVLYSVPYFVSEGIINGRWS